MGYPHYSKIKTKITSKNCLVQALKDMGFLETQIRVTEKAMQLEGYENKLRKEEAEIIIPRRYVGSAANDIGFKLQKDGTYGAIISDYDKGNHCSSKRNSHSEGVTGYGDKWLKKLTQRYSYNKVKEQLSDQGFFIEEEHSEDGQIYLECSTSGFGG